MLLNTRRQISLCMCTAGLSLKIFNRSISTRSVNSIAALQSQRNRLFYTLLHPIRQQQQQQQQQRRNFIDKKEQLQPQLAKKEELRENIYTIPNALTVSRIIMSPIIGLCIINQSFALGLGLLIVAGATDALDGWIARRFNMTSSIGSVLDPAADKILMTTLVLSLTQVGSLPVPLAILIIGRDVYLGLRTAFYRYQTLPSPKTWSRYWDFSLVSAEIKPPMISKVNTVLQLALMATSLTGSVYGFLLHPALEALRYSVALTTILSTLHYIFDKDTMKLKIK